MNYQVNFDLAKISDRNLDFGVIKNATVNFYNRQPGVSFAADMALSEDIRYQNGYRR